MNELKLFYVNNVLCLKTLRIRIWELLSEKINEKSIY